MSRSVQARVLAGAIAVAVATLSSGPAHVTHGHGNSASLPTRLNLPAHVILHGTLVTLHRAQRTGDLLLAAGDLLPLRFTAAAQMRGLHVGDGLDVAADASGHARLLVHAVRDQGFGSHWTGSHWTGSHWTGSHWTGSHWTGRTWTGSHWTGSHWTGSHWTVHGVIARLLGHGTAEVVGVNGAAVVVRTSGATVAGVAGTGSTGGLGAPSIATAATGAALAYGEGIDAEAALTGQGAVTLTRVQIVVSHVARIDLEGTVTRVNRTTATITLTDENGLQTIIAVGRAKGYRVGQSVEVTGAPAGAIRRGEPLLRAHVVESESTAPSTTRPVRGSTATAIPTTKPAGIASATATRTLPTTIGTAQPGRSATATAAAPRVTGPTASVTPVPSTSNTVTTRSTNTPTTAAVATAAAAASRTATVTAPTAPTPRATPAAATDTVASIATDTAAPTVLPPTATPTATGTATNTATAAPTSSATTPPTATSTATSTSTATPTATSTATSTSTATPTATLTATSTSTATPTASATATIPSQASCQAVTPTPFPTETNTVTPINSPTPTATGMPAGLTVQYKVGDPHAPCDGYVVPNLHIHNGGSGGVALNKLTIRYWFTADTTQPQNWFPSTVSTSNVTETAQIVTTTAPLSGADHYIQYSFANGGLNPGSDSPDITITLCKPGSATNGQCPSNPEYFDEYNDYSYNPFMTSYQDWDRVTLYYQGTLIWGYEPPSLP